MTLSLPIFCIIIGVTFTMHDRLWRCVDDRLVVGSDFMTGSCIAYVA